MVDFESKLLVSHCNIPIIKYYFKTYLCILTYSVYSTGRNAVYMGTRESVNLDMVVITIQRDVTTRSTVRDIHLRNMVVTTDLST